MATNNKLPKSRLMIQYDTRVEGELKKKELPHRVLVIGDLSKGRSKDAKLELEDRPIRDITNSVNVVLKDLGISTTLKVPNSITPKKSPLIEVNLDINSMSDFKPDQIAKKVPELNALLQLREMLSSFEKDIDNNRTLKKTIDSIFSDKESLKKLKDEIPRLEQYCLTYSKDDIEGSIESEAEEESEAGAE